MTTQIIPERLAALTTITLDNGAHTSWDDGHCAMEVVAWLAGEGNTDAPECASDVLRMYTISLNDRWNNAQRQQLRPYLPRMVGTAGDGQDEARSYLALDWLIRTYTPAWLDLAGLHESATELRDLRRIADLTAAEAAGPAARTARTQASAAWVAVRVAVRAAAWVAVRAAAWVALAPTVATLQASALDLLDRMIDPSAAATR